MEMVDQACDECRKPNYYVDTGETVMAASK
jgi:hypothetical protein